MSVASSGNGLDLTVRDFGAGQKVFGRYTLIRTLGRGGMGVVWLARDNVLERDVALKFLPELIVHDRAVLSDLKRETRRSLELTHKNIVRIYDFVHDETTGCISMEYIDGDTLSNLRVDRPSKIFEPHELTAWIKQLCEALDYAHNYVRVVHRDLKPSNLMVTKRDDLKVADFGIARSLGDSVSMLTMGRTTTSGTLLYMSPQQLDGEQGTPLDDIYSLGATIYELLTSKPPFFSGNIDRQIREKIPRPMSDRRIELEIEGEPINETWEKVVAACLQKEPSSRPQSVAEIPELLAVPSGPARKTRQQAAVPRVKRVPKRRFRRAAVWITGAVSATSKAMFRGAALAISVPSKAISRGAAVGVAAMKKDFRDTVLDFRAASKAISRGTTAGVRAANQMLYRTGVMVFAGAKVVARGTAVAVPALTRELLRGVAVTVIPAAVVAACVWFFAIRPPPPKRVVQQPLPKMQPSQPPQVQPSAVPNESPVAKAAPVLQPATQRVPESTPSPPIEGSLSLETTPAGATVIVDGSITKTSPATFSNLAVGKHQLQIVLEGYVTQEKEVEINEGQVTSQGVVTLYAREQPQPAATPNTVQAMPPNEPVQKENEQKVAVATKPTRTNRPAKAQAKKSAAPVTRQAAAPPPPTAKSISKPAPAPKPSVEPKRLRNPFGESAPGG
jgi:hypothetical protein